jgi:putative ABC transport system permease protein
MLRNYLKTALRNLWRGRGFTAINVIGLAIGLSTCLLILIFVMDETSYDRYNVNAGRIYRIDGEVRFGDNYFNEAAGAAPIGPTALREIPEVEKEVRLRDYGGIRVKKGSQNIQESAVIYADSTLFDVFTLPMIAGDPATALKEPHTVVITETMAKKYFDAIKNVVGKTIPYLIKSPG